MDLKNSIISYIDEQQHCMTLLKSKSDKINDICNQLLNARNKRKNIFVFGNGGSGSTASHFVSDLLKTCILKESKRFNAICLSDNVPVLTAWANDTSYDEVFLEQLKNSTSINDISVDMTTMQEIFQLQETYNIKKQEEKIENDLKKLGYIN